MKENWVTPLDSRLTALGGIVHRVEAIPNRRKTRVKQFRRETEAKLSTLEAQAAKVKDDAKG